MTPEKTARPGVSLITQLPLLLFLIALWLVLWGQFDVISVSTGIIFSLLVVRFFYLPPVELTGRFNLWFTIILLFRFVWWLVSASFQMAWLAVRPQKVPTASIIAVRLHTHSDWLITVAAEINMLVPGSVVVEVDRLRGILYLHILDGDTDEKVEKARRSSYRIEDAIALALGGREDIWRINKDRVEHGRKRLLSSKKQRDYEERAELVRKELEREWEAEL
ncbi:Na+/H+ antiporter subunit E [Gulosibacter molinativorax]|uniref:Na+/H+ antiporter subunit E n=1 Tax=Gulosibacter molinativorax TaxID=256821 RepID=A0ABT7C9P2_9MICO|nr:Na+/H+ antiporter subunit E [Gulosibacter molinativorax]MDJ1371931.1 Na+/H+ antiporter subunit E [Gulosibacter molinativorax]QUY62580.1 Monovalent cation/H+ antiporter subunit E [Gulosibacter molinativorax]